MWDSCNLHTIKQIAHCLWALKYGELSQNWGFSEGEGELRTQEAYEYGIM